MINISQKEFNQLSDFIRNNYGINLGDKKQALVVSRLQNILQNNKFKSFSEYYNYVVSDKTDTAITTLLNSITTNYTYFMREEKHFDFFKDSVLPYITQMETERDLRVWCAGCSSGEEAYTLAMLISDYLGPNKNQWNRKILATDISEKVLDLAIKGEYSNDKLAKLPRNWKLNNFKQVNSSTSIVNKEIKNEIIFRSFNLMTENFPFKRKFHVIFCRNVMIYFDNVTKDKLINKFYDSLEYGGYLFIGHSETINRETSKFKYIMPAVYRKE